MDETPNSPPRVRAAIPKPDTENALDGAQVGAAEGRPRIIVRFRCLRRKMLDRDNLYGSVKPLLDSLKKACLIPDDNEEEIALEVYQDQLQRRANRNRDRVP